MPNQIDENLRIATIACLGILFKAVETGFATKPDTLTKPLGALIKAMEQEGNIDAANLFQRILAAADQNHPLP
jgi:hypothetical protein